MTVLAAIGSVLIRDFRTVSALTPVIAHEEAIVDPPAAVPARSPQLGKDWPNLALATRGFDRSRG